MLPQGITCSTALMLLLARLLGSMCLGTGRWSGASEDVVGADAAQRHTRRAGWVLELILPGESPVVGEAHLEHTRLGTLHALDPQAGMKVRRAYFQARRELLERTLEPAAMFAGELLVVPPESRCGEGCQKSALDDCRTILLPHLEMRESASGYSHR